jgi:alpha-L-fucosidase 2
MKQHLIFIILIVGNFSAISQPTANDNLVFDSVATRWDEAMPLGNGWLGALIWQKGKNIRLSLDRVDLWDDRPMPEIDKLRFKWVTEQVQKKQYAPVQKIGDEPYEKYPAPTKIPGVALEFELSKFGKVMRNELDIRTALSTIKFENGVAFRNYIHATRQVGYFSFENCAEDIVPLMKIPPYNSVAQGKRGNSVECQGLQRLGYAKGTVENGKNFIRYHQPT